MTRFAPVLALFLAAAGQASASTWADRLFDELSRDFGSVPRGTMLTHPFRLVNNTKQQVQISGVRVSCSACTSARALQTTLAPGQETAIVVQMDTRRFSNTKNVTVSVTFSEPRMEEVRLSLQANSRDDVVITPETLAFGRIKRGASPSTSATVTFFTAAPVKVSQARCDSNYVKTTLKLVRSQEGEVTYQISATMRPDAPVGKWFSDIWLKTNNPNMPRVRVPLTVEIESPLTVSPMSVSVGPVRAGSETDRKVVIRGIRPFRITRIAGADNEVSVRDSASTPQQVHVLTVTLRPMSVGELQRTIRIHTDIPAGGDIEFTTQALVMP